MRDKKSMPVFVNPPPMQVILPTPPAWVRWATLVFLVSLPVGGYYLGHTQGYAAGLEHNAAASQEVIKKLFLCEANHAP